MAKYNVRGSGQLGIRQFEIALVGCDWESFLSGSRRHPQRIEQVS
jgi:hypothetical protein